MTVPIHLAAVHHAVAGACEAGKHSGPKACKDGAKRRLGQAETR